MVLALVLLAIAAVAPQATGLAPQEVPALKAGIGPCSADFTVTDAAGKPVYLATIHTKLRYGAVSVKRMDLEVSTNADGKARLESLPAKGKLVTYDVRREAKSGRATQDLAKACHATLQVVIK